MLIEFYEIDILYFNEGFSELNVKLFNLEIRFENEFFNCKCDYIDIICRLGILEFEIKIGFLNF